MALTGRRFAVLATLALLASSPAAVAQPTIVFDYTYDTNNFFGAVGSPQRIALQAAATALTSRLTDTLTAITPGGSNTFTPSFPNPATGSTQTVSNLNVPLNTIIVYAGGRDLTGGTLGIGGPGGYSAGGSSSFLTNVATRGQTGANASPATDFGPWGGAITFDSVGTNWNFLLTAPTAGQADFLSVAEHELGHLLGIGTAGSWTAKVSGTSFTGTASTAANGGTNPATTADGGHWADGTTSVIETTNSAQEAAMDPSILLGTRKVFTRLDFAGLSDVGWQVSPVPEPGTTLGAGTLALAGIGAVRRRWRNREGQKVAA